jgi:hypothetical protein
MKTKQEIEDRIKHQEENIELFKKERGQEANLHATRIDVLILTEIKWALYGE